MAILQGCLGSSETGHTYTVQAYPVLFWTNVGTCTFKQSGPSVIEISGSCSLFGKEFNFDIIVTDGSGGQPVLTVNGQADDCATLSGCELKACNTLNGCLLAFQADGKDTIIETPKGIPNLKIQY